MSNAAIAILCAALGFCLVACGGGSVDDDEPIQLASWEESPGICTFKTRAEYDAAKRKGAQCQFAVIGEST